jgi:hypothetical protein
MIAGAGALLLAGAALWRHRDAGAADGRRTVAILYTNTNIGYIEPCG